MKLLMCRRPTNKGIQDNISDNGEFIRHFPLLLKARNNNGQFTCRSTNLQEETILKKILRIINEHPVCYNTFIGHYIRTTVSLSLANKMKIVNEISNIINGWKC